MPRPKHNPYAELRPIVALLADLTHDELRDLADMLQSAMAKTAEELPLRKGLPPVGLILSGGWQYRDNPPLYTAPARRELKDAYEAAYDLNNNATWLIVDFARVLCDALAPIKDRKQHDNQPTARGSIEAKYIPRWVSVDDGQPEQRLYGPYLYYRYLATGGDKDKKKKRQKNQYIGAPSLAVLYLATEPGSTERRELEALIIAAHKAGTIEALTKQLVLEDKPKSEE